MLLAAIDPGINGCGCALVHKETQSLVAAWYASNPAPPTLTVPARATALARQVRLFIEVHTEAEHLALPGELILEWPRVYASRIRSGTSKGDPNDLLGLAAMLGALAALFPDTDVHALSPREWKGTIDGDAKVKQIQAALTPAETQRVELPAAHLQHNVWDAVGLGLWAVGRGGKRRIIARE